MLFHHTTWREIKLNGARCIVNEDQPQIELPESRWQYSRAEEPLSKNPSSEENVVAGRGQISHPKALINSLKKK